MPYAVPVALFADIGEEFVERIRNIDWCTIATVDTRDRPRSRIVHPIWEGNTGWIGTLRNAHLKGKHLAHNPYVSLTNIADIPARIPVRPVYVDCRAEWEDTPADKRHAWKLFLESPPPLGYHPAEIFGFAGIDHPEHPDFGVLRLKPWRIELVDGPGQSRVWRA